MATSGAALVGWSAGPRDPWLRWAALGWAAAAVPGMVFGTWLARRHGTPGTGFVVAMGTGILVRFVTVLGSLAFVLNRGGGLQRPWLAGLVAGYVPLQLFELAWFVRRGRRWTAVAR